MQFSLGQYGWGAWGGLGVLLFFLLSGFLITTLLLRERDKTGGINLRAFYARRALRILPAALCFLGAVSLLMLLGFVTDVTWGGIAASVLFIRNIRGSGESIGHMWSLSLEEQFYFVWPFLLSRLDRRRAFVLCSCLILGCWIWRTAAIVGELYPYEGGKFYIRTDFRIDSILVGCWIAIVWTRPEVRDRLCSFCGQLPLALLLAALGWWSFYGERVEGLRPVFLTVQVILASLVFLSVLCGTPESFATRFLHQSVMVWLGRVSYSLYLWQQIFLVTQTPSWGILRSFPVNLLATFAVALVSYYGVETPALRLKRKYSVRVIPKPTDDFQ